jgi:WD repeat-containing protein 49
MEIFKEHENEEGESDVDQATFRAILHSILGDLLSDDQLNLMFMRIDANSDGTLSWDEFSSYMMSRSSEKVASSHQICDVRLRHNVRTQHQEVIVLVDYVVRERRYVTVSKDGMVCLWDQNLAIQRVMDTKDYLPIRAWINDAIYLHEQNKLVCVFDERQ